MYLTARTADTGSHIDIHLLFKYRTHPEKNPLHFHPQFFRIIQRKDRIQLFRIRQTVHHLFLTGRINLIKNVTDRKPNQLMIHRTKSLVFETFLVNMQNRQIEYLLTAPAIFLTSADPA